MRYPLVYSSAGRPPVRAASAAGRTKSGVASTLRRKLAMSGAYPHNARYTLCISARLNGSVTNRIANVVYSIFGAEPLERVVEDGIMVEGESLPRHFGHRPPCCLACIGTRDGFRQVGCQRDMRDRHHLEAGGDPRVVVRVAVAAELFVVRTPAASASTPVSSYPAAVRASVN